MTLAVTGTGPDQVYPARTRNWPGEIIGQGALLTPFPPGTEVRPGNFPARNRIISGMSLGTLVIEAGLRSGSLITARLASEQGREVFAIPGSVHNPQARGCHQLIRQGAQTGRNRRGSHRGTGPAGRPNWPAPCNNCWPLPITIHP
jgi:DNA processing protein